MSVKRGEIWMADLNPTRGSEQAGVRPVMIFQNDLVSKFTTTILTIPLSTTLHRASLPSCVKIPKGEGGLRYKADNSGEEYLGFIAEDVPALVAMDDRKHLNPMDLDAVFAKVIQMQQEMLKEQQETSQHCLKRSESLS